MTSIKLICVVSLAMFTTVPTLARTIWYVDGVHGSDSNNCKSSQHACKTIGHAINLASSGDSVLVAPAVYKENLSIGMNLKVIGAGAKTTIIDGRQKGSVVSISTGIVTFSKLCIRNGAAREGGGVNINSGAVKIIDSVISENVANQGGLGGGISNGGMLTITNSTITGNSSVRGTCNEFCLEWGGGIANGSTLTISNSTVSDNRAGFGGGIFNGNGGAVLVINNSAISDNSASALGGGIWNRFGATAINNSTVSGNSEIGIANGDDNIGGTLTISNSTISGNPYNFWSYPDTTTAFQNSIVANGPAGNCHRAGGGGVITSKGYNLSSDDSCNFNNTGDLNNTDPKLGTLGHYGGPTETMPLLSGSPAIDAGNPAGCTDGKGHLLKTDQRGKPRPDKEDTGGCDMGAYERQKD